MLNSLQSFFRSLINLRSEDLFQLLCNVLLIYLILYITVVKPLSALYLRFFSKGDPVNKSTQTKPFEKEPHRETLEW